MEGRLCDVATAPAGAVKARLHATTGCASGCVVYIQPDESCQTWYDRIVVDLVEPRIVLRNEPHVTLTLPYLTFGRTTPSGAVQRSDHPHVTMSRTFLSTGVA